MKKFNEAVTSKDNISKLAQALLDALATGNKAEFALDILYSEDLTSITVPEYIRNGLEWLENKLLQRQQEIQLTQGENTEVSGKVEDD